MNAEQIESISKIADLLNDRSLAKGIGDCLQVLARIAAKNLSEFDSPGNPPPEDVVDQAETESIEDEFYACEYRSVREVANFINRSKTFVAERIHEGTFDAKKNLDNGFYEISTTSIRNYVLSSQ